ncbi:MAG TPA: hypothetical protein VFQ44_00300 [Streptosporangiaceae bacterium]|nr:hypothetical protein [Streptosporangiaceae bacterium]
MIKQAAMLIALASGAAVLAGCGGTESPAAAPVRSASAAASAPPASASSYAVDQGWAGTACVLPVAAVQAIFGPLAPITNPNVTVTGGYVEMQTNNSTQGGPGCSEVWYPQAYSNYGQSVNIAFATDGADSYKTDITESKWAPVPAGLKGEVLGTDSDPHDAALVVPARDGYIYLGLSSDDTGHPVSVADGTKALQVIIDVARKSPPQGLQGIADLP